MKLKDACSLEGSYDRLSQHTKKQRHHFADRSPYGQSYGFSNSHVQIWELDQKEGWAPKNWCFQILVLEKTHESPLNSREIKPVNPKRNQPRLFIGRTDAKAPILMLQYFGHLMWRAKSLEKTLMLGKMEGRRRKVWQKIRWLDGIIDSIDMSWANSGRWWRTGKPGVLQSMGVTNSWTWQRD